MIACQSNSNVAGDQVFYFTNSPTANRLSEEAVRIMVSNLPHVERKSDLVIASDIVRLANPLVTLARGIPGLYAVPEFRATNYTFSEITQRLLGENSMSRLRDFLHTKRGWKFGRGEPVKRASLADMEQFLSFHERFVTESLGQPNVFLTESGAVELTWKKGSGCYLLVRFLGFGHVRYYIENSDNCFEEVGMIDDFVIDAGMSLC